MNDPLLSIADFCKRNGGISRTTLHYLDKDGKGPRKLKIGARVCITPEAEAEWRLRMEAETAALDASPTSAPQTKSKQQPKKRKRSTP